MKHLTALLLLLASLASAAAQSSPPTFADTQTLAVTSTSAAVTLPESKVSAAMVLFNDGPNELFWTTGATATTSNTPLPAGQAVCVKAASGSLAAVAASARTTTLRVSHVSECPVFATLVPAPATVPLTNFPSGATPITISATGTTGAVTATLAAQAAKTTYICGFTINASANAATVVNATVTQVITGTMNFSQYVALKTAGVATTQQTFTPCVPASAVNTTIPVISGAAGTGGVTSVSAWGFQL